MKNKEELSVELHPINIQRISLRLVGDSELIVHNWAEKTKKEMLAKHMQTTVSKKGPKDPFQDYVNSLYFLNGRNGEKITTQRQLVKNKFGVLDIAFKHCAVAACSGADLTKVLARQAFHVPGELVEIKGTPKMREDMVRVGRGAPDLRYRAGFLPWSVSISISYNADVMSAEQIVNLFNLGGFAVGVYEWRPQRNGPYGRFHVETS